MPSLYLTTVKLRLKVACQLPVTGTWTNPVVVASMPYASPMLCVSAALLPLLDLPLRLAAEAAALLQAVVAAAAAEVPRQPLTALSLLLTRCCRRVLLVLSSRDSPATDF